MKHKPLAFTSLFLALAVLLSLVSIRMPGLTAQASPAGELMVSPSSDYRQTAEALQGGSLMFVENAGQFAYGVHFQVRGAMGSSLWLAEDGIWITVLEQTTEEEPGIAPSPGPFGPL